MRGDGRPKKIPSVDFRVDAKDKDTLSPLRNTEVARVDYDGVVQMVAGIMGLSSYGGQVFSMSRPEHSWHILHKKRSRSEMMHEREVNVYKLISLVTDAGVVQAMSGESLAGRPAEQEITLRAIGQGDLCDMCRIKRRNVLFQEDRCSVGLAKIFSIG